MERAAFTVAEVAKLLGIGKTTAYQLVNTGEIPSAKIGRAKRVVTKGQLDEYVKKLEASARRKP